MAVRNIVKNGDPVLSKKSRKVENFDARLWTLLDDMKETMYKANGVGLAAVQVGTLRRVVVMDCGDGYIELINPEIVKAEGEQFEQEGCLSFPDEWLYTDRPMHVTVRYTNRKGEECEITASGFLAKALTHEIDHLDGKVMFCRRAPEDKIPQEEEARPRKKRRAR